VATAEKGGHQRLNLLASVFWQNKRLVVLGAIGLAAIVVFSNVLVPPLAIVALGIIASYSTSYKRIFRIPPAIELVTFTTVVVGLAYGPVVGALYGAIVTFTAELMTNALDVFILSFVPSRAVIGFAAGWLFDLFSSSMLLTGLAASVLYNLLCQPMYLLMSDMGMRMKSVFFILLNVGSNFVIFFVFGRFALLFLRFA
jgi:hypothetical protein